MLLLVTACSGGEASTTVTGRISETGPAGFISRFLDGRVEVYEGFPVPGVKSRRDLGRLVEAQNVETGEEFSFSLGPGLYTLARDGGCATRLTVTSDERLRQDVVCRRAR